LLRTALSERNRRAVKRDELTQLRERLIAQGATRSVLGFNLGPVHAVRLQLRALDDALRAIAVELAIGGRRWPTIEIAIADLEQEMVVTTTAIARVESDLEKFKLKERQRADRAASAAKRDRERQNRLDANAFLAARARGEIRSESSRLRSRLSRDHPCPYCGGELGPNMHADHIHPVAKGGLPVESNYVMVCQRCNQAKRDSTLNQFIDRMGLNREVVLRALKMLGKDA